MGVIVDSVVLVGCRCYSSIWNWTPFQLGLATTVCDNDAASVYSKWPVSFWYPRMEVLEILKWQLQEHDAYNVTKCRKLLTAPFWRLYTCNITFGERYLFEDTVRERTWYVTVKADTHYCRETPVFRLCIDLLQHISRRNLCFFRRGQRNIRKEGSLLPIVPAKEC